MLKMVNLVLLLCVMIEAFWLIGKRYQSRTEYTALADLNNQAIELSKEYSRLQIEVGTFSSDWVLKDVAENKLGLVEPDKKHVAEIK